MTLLDLDLGRWGGSDVPGDDSVLERARGPVLDVGCGPGRHVRALARRGVLALGLDASPVAVQMARERGTTAVVQASIFDPLPGGWGSALLLDGSLGIGGNPVELLRRVGYLLRGDGCALVETEAPGHPTRVVEATVQAGPVRPWAVVGADALPVIAEAAGLSVTECWTHEARWFWELG